MKRPCSKNAFRRPKLGTSFLVPGWYELSRWDKEFVSQSLSECHSRYPHGCAVNAGCGGVEGRDRPPDGQAGSGEMIGRGCEVQGRPQPDRSERRSLPTQANDHTLLN